MFEKLEGLSHSERLQFLADLQLIMKHDSYSKNHLLHVEGTICNHVFFIQKGLARAFYHKDGQEITAHFAVENGFITAIDSFIQRKKSRYNIELLEDSIVISISHQDLYQLLEKSSKYEKFVRMYLEQIYIDLAERLEDLLFHTAKERYNKLIQKMPNLLLRVNLKHIASYLGITQETLSRIRAKD